MFKMHQRRQGVTSATNSEICYSSCRLTTTTADRKARDDDPLAACWCISNTGVLKYNKHLQMTLLPVFADLELRLLSVYAQSVRRSGS